MRHYRPIGRFRIPPVFWSVLCAAVAEQCQGTLAPVRLRRFESALMTARVGPGKDVYLALDATDAGYLQELLGDWLSDR